MQDEAIKEALEEIAAKHNGLLRAQDVLEEASKPTNILHLWSGFEWDQSKAAFKYNLQQARALIRVTVEYVGPTGDETLSRVFVSLSTDRTKKGGGYRSLVTVVDDDILQSQLLEDAIRDMQRFKQRYATLKATAEVIRAMNSAEEKIGDAVRIGKQLHPSA